jgi:outer membrane protein OmpA-like peptidoglycan-associated protein
MYIQATALLLVVGALTSGTAIAQTAPNPTQERTAISPDQTPVFRVTVVGRTTPAINYRPRRGATKIDFDGTALMPQARGEARVEGKKGYIEIDAKFDELEAPAQFGREYLTYVLWAVTPEGRARNLGEVQVDDDDARVEVTTELQAFGLIVTAEPYFAVTQPSDVVVLENIVRDDTEGKVDVIQAKYELLKRGTYLMNKDPGDWKATALEPGEPLDLAEARNAVLLARLASADRYAGDTYQKALGLLGEAEEARRRRRGGNAVMMPARQAVQTAEDARLIALQKQEEEHVAQERARVEQREAAALERARNEEALRRQAEIDKEIARRRAELETEAARRQAEIETEAIRRQTEMEKANANAALLAAEREKAAAEREKAAADEARATSDAARAASDAARVAAEAQAQQAKATAEQAERERTELRERLREQLNRILETRETARGLIVNLSDVLFDTASANLKPGAREKLAKVAGVLLGHPGLNVAVEGHTDSVGTEGYNQQLSERRAASVREYLVRQGIAPGMVATSGFGESQPVVSNSTSAGRQQNRRVELVVSGEAIGTTASSIRRNQD